MNDHTLSTIFQHYLETENPNGYLKKISELMISENLSRNTFDSMLEDEGLTGAPNLKESLLDLILYYAERCIQDHELSDEEQQNIWILCTIFRVEDGDFVKFRERAVQNIITTQISWILKDRFVSNSEELLQSNIQRAFGLGYDQYVNFAKPIIKTHIKELEEMYSNSQSSTDKEKILFCIQNLRGVFIIS